MGRRGSGPSETLTSPLYLEEVLRLIVEMAARTMEARTCSLLLIDEETKELVTAAVHSAAPGYLNRPSLRVGDGITGRVAREGKPIAVADVQQDPRYQAREMAAHSWRRMGRAEKLAKVSIVSISAAESNASQCAHA